MQLKLISRHKETAETSTAIQRPQKLQRAAKQKLAWALQLVIALAIFSVNRAHTLDHHEKVFVVHTISATDCSRSFLVHADDR